MKRILVLDGGGCKGLMQAVVLSEIESLAGRPVHQIFDLIVGSSVGAILGSVLAAGNVSAYLMQKSMTEFVPRLFSRRPWPLLPKYDRQRVFTMWRALGLDGLMMYEVRTKFMCTAVSYVDRMTHFFKSWHADENNRSLYSVQARSWAAPLYFGKIVDLDGVWGDGGCGLYNCPLSYAIEQGERFGWIGREETHVLSIGTGHSVDTMTPEQARRASNTRQVLAFLNPDSGGWARYESAMQAVKSAQARASRVPGLTFQRLDRVIPKSIDKLDGKSEREIRAYLEIGRSLSAELDMGRLL